MERKFILCYHDFSVRNFRQASEHIRLLSDAADGPIAIAVIPSTEGATEEDIHAFKDELNRLIFAGQNCCCTVRSIWRLSLFPGAFWGRRLFF